MPDGGRVTVCGFDPQKNPTELKHEIGAALQSTSLPDKIRVMRSLRLFASFYGRGRKVDELLKRFGLEEKRNAFYSQLSGGQKQRLALAMALVNDPKVLFFDEPTAGLDPQVRREIYDIIEELKREKKTIVLTTHYIEEAERLCDRVAIVDHGKVIALGTPRELKAKSANTTRIEVRLAQPEADRHAEILEGVVDARESTVLTCCTATRPRRPSFLSSSISKLHGNELVSSGNRHALARRRVHRTHRKEATRLTNLVTLTRVRMQLALRNKMFFFFSVVMPLGFFFLYAGVSPRAIPRWSVFFWDPVLALQRDGQLLGTERHPGDVPRARNSAPFPCHSGTSHRHAGLQHSCKFRPDHPHCFVEFCCSRVSYFTCRSSAIFWPSLLVYLHRHSCRSARSVWSSPASPTPCRKLRSSIRFSGFR